MVSSNVCRRVQPRVLASSGSVAVQEICMGVGRILCWVVQTRVARGCRFCTPTTDAHGSRRGGQRTRAPFEAHSRTSPQHTYAVFVPLSNFLAVISIRPELMENRPHGILCLQRSRTTPVPLWSLPSESAKQPALLLRNLVIVVILGTFGLVGKTFFKVFVLVRNSNPGPTAF